MPRTYQIPLRMNAECWRRLLAMCARAADDAEDLAVFELVDAKVKEAEIPPTRLRTSKFATG